MHRPHKRMAQLQAVYDGAPVGLDFLDCDLRYVNLNKSLAEMNGGTVEDHLGALVEDMVPEIFHNAETYLHRALEGEAIADVEATVPATASSAEKTRLVSYQPARDEAGEMVGAFHHTADATGIFEGRRVDFFKNQGRERISHFQTVWLAKDGQRIESTLSGTFRYMNDAIASTVG